MELQVRWYDITWLIVLFAGFFLLGWFGNKVYSFEKDYLKPSQSITGLWLPDNNLSHSQALASAKDYNNVGNWVCVNIEGMDINTMIKTCEHEISHEIFAEKCTQDFTYCLGAFKK